MKSIKSAAEKTMSEIVNLVKNQNTTRRKNFTDKNIKQENLDIIKTSILKTANASNRQSYSIIVLDAAHAKALDLPGDKVFLFCIDFCRLHLCAAALKHDFDSQFIMQFVTALTDISMLAQSSILVAQSLGIGTLITNEIYQNKLDETFKLLNLPPKYVFPMLAVCFGYSNTKDSTLKGRIEPYHVFHDNSYKYPNDDEITNLIQEYDETERNAGLVKDWKEKGYKHYLEWFFEKWCPVIGSRKENGILINALRQHGII